MMRCVSPPEPNPVLASDWPLCQSFSVTFCIRWNLGGADRFARWHRYQDKVQVCMLDNVQKKKKQKTEKTTTLKSNWYFERQIVNSLLSFSTQANNPSHQLFKTKSGSSQLDAGLSDGTWYYSLDLWNHVHFSCSTQQKIKKAIILCIKSVAAAPSVHQSALWNNNTLCCDSLINSCSHFHTAGVGGASPTINAQQEYFTSHNR